MVEDQEPVEIVKELFRISSFFISPSSQELFLPSSQSELTFGDTSSTSILLPNSTISSLKMSVIEVRAPNLLFDSVSFPNQTQLSYPLMLMLGDFPCDEEGGNCTFDIRLKMIGDHQTSTSPNKRNLS